MSDTKPFHPLPEEKPIHFKPTAKLPSKRPFSVEVYAMFAVELFHLKADGLKVTAPFDGCLRISG